MANLFANVLSEIRAIPLSAPIGRVIELGRGTVTVTGLQHAGCLGDRVMIRGEGGPIGGAIRAVGVKGGETAEIGRSARRLPR